MFQNLTGPFLLTDEEKKRSDRQEEKIRNKAKLQNKKNQPTNFDRRKSSRGGSTAASNPKVGGGEHFSVNLPSRRLFGLIQGYINQSDREMDNDFTFCKVPSSVDGDDVKEEKTLASEIGGITIKDEKSNGLDRSIASSSKEEKVSGTLSFTIVDKSSPQQQQPSSRQVASRTAETSAKIKQPAKKPVARAKVPFEKGYSQMDWLNLTRTHPDLAGLKGESNRRLIPLSEVKQHRSEGSMWTVLKGRVYNLTPYMKFHPGGEDMLLKAVGKDCTALFNKYHAWVNAEFLMEKCLVGMLDESR